MAIKITLRDYEDVNLIVGEYIGNTFAVAKSNMDRFFDLENGTENPEYKFCGDSLQYALDCGFYIVLIENIADEESERDLIRAEIKASNYAAIRKLKGED
jgi:hypothetical protein